MSGKPCVTLSLKWSKISASLSAGTCPFKCSMAMWPPMGQHGAGTFHAIETLQALVGASRTGQFREYFT